MNGLLCKSMIKVDFLGPVIGLEIDSSNRYKSAPGAIFSILIIIASLVISTLFGTEIITRKNPTVSYSAEYVENSQIFLEEIPFYFDFSFPNGSVVPDYTKFLDSSINIQSVDDANRATQDLTSLSIEQCQFNRFLPKYQTLFDSFRNQTNRFYCANFNSSSFVLNERTTINSSITRTIFRKCSTHCLPDTNLLIGVNYLSSYIDVRDLTNPVKYSIMRNTVILVSGIQKLNFYQFTRDIINSDEGWILEAKNNFEFISANPIEADITTNNGLPGSTIYTAVIHSKRLKSSISRSYMKIQELAAKVGGFVNIIIISLSILTSHYLRFKYLVYVYSSLKKHQDYRFHSPDKSAVINLQSCENILERPAKSAVPADAGIIQINQANVHKFINDSSSKLQITDKILYFPDLGREFYLSYLISKLSCNKKKSQLRDGLNESKRALEFESFNKIYYNHILHNTKDTDPSPPIQSLNN